MDLDGFSLGYQKNGCYFDSFSITCQIFSVLEIIAYCLSIYIKF